VNTSQPYDVAFSVHAGCDLREIRRYLTKNASARVALKIVAGLFEAIETLQDQPERYPPEPLLADRGN